MRFIQFGVFSFSLLSYLFFVSCQYVPNPRIGQSSALIGTKLYFFGGSPADVSPLSTPIGHPNISNDVFYFDLSNSSLFNTVTPTWYKDVEMPIGSLYHTSCVNPNDSAVFIFGGRQFLPNSNNLSVYSPVYRLDHNKNSWSIPNITGLNSTFANRTSIQAVIDITGKVFIFGGGRRSATGGDPSYYNDMNIFDITSMSWSTLVISQAPPPSYAYTATLLPSGIIVYIGGIDYISGIIPVNMSEIRTFNTTSLTWTIKSANGSSIGSRVGHSAVLNQNGDIIIYGGSENDTLGPQVFPDLAVLNTNSWMWSIPNIPSSNIPQALTAHSAVLYKNYMFVAFGVIASTGGTIYNKDYYILDTQKYVWVTTNNSVITTQGPSKIQGSQPNKAIDPSSNDGNKIKPLLYLSLFFYIYMFF
ncbi:galactose oxidase [Gigaspora margarita]|uniref:Galactose oxidase n=1 Tax=Gigaspora margarita TaxID=4874 RepID=A0A8H4AA69_GIGMA|nr:galactose oxidase [Gigaspora margarita]